MKVFVAQPEWPITQLCVSVLLSVICHSCLFTIITPRRTVSMSIFKVNETSLINVLVYVKAYKKQMYTSKIISRD